MKSLKVITILVTLALFATSTLGTNGYFSHGYGTHYKGLAGVGAAMPLSSLGVAVNPAGLAFLGTRYDIGVGIFSPDRSYTVSGNPSGQGFGLTPGKVESDSKIFLLPSLGANWKINEMSSIGAAIYGNGGMRSNYDTKTFDNPQAPVTAPTGVDLTQIFASVTYSRQIVEGHALGISLIFGYQMFEAEGLQAFAGFSSAPEKVSNNDMDNSTGFGARIGYMGTIVPGLRIGASYQTKIAMSEFDDYAGLFAEQGDFDIPSNWTAGFAYDFSDKFTFAADVQQILYTDAKAVSNPLDPATLNPQFYPNQFVPLGNDDAAGFGWDDVTVFKFGAQWHAMPTWTFRAGFSTCDQPIPESEMLFNILAPGVIEQHITFGFTKELGDKAIHFAGMYAFSNSVEGPNTLEVPGAQTIELEMSQWEFELGFSF